MTYAKPGQCGEKEPLKSGRCILGGNSPSHLTLTSRDAAVDGIWVSEQETYAMRYGTEPVMEAAWRLRKPAWMVSACIAAAHCKRYSYCTYKIEDVDAAVKKYFRPHLIMLDRITKYAAVSITTMELYLKDVGKDFVHIGTRRFVTLDMIWAAQAWIEERATCKRMVHARERRKAIRMAIQSDRRLPGGIRIKVPQAQKAQQALKETVEA